LEKVFYEAGSIVSFKLINGEEIVAKMEHDDGEQWVIDQPLLVVPLREGGIQFAPPMMSVVPGQTFRLSKRQVVLDNLSAEQVADHYRKLTTGIETVRKPGIILG